MKKLVEIEPVCPFIGKKCIADGWQWNSLIQHPCAFYDENTMCREYPEEPCLIKRAINKILENEETSQAEDISASVPWDTSEKE